MLPLSLSLSLVLLIALAPLIQAQCADSSYVPCLPAGSESGGAGSIPPDDFGDSGIWDSLQGAALDPIQGRSVLRRQLASRQNALCCKPTNQCLLLTDGNIPFCYVSTHALRLLFLSGFTASQNFFRNTLCAKAQETELGHHQILLLGR